MSNSMLPKKLGLKPRPSRETLISPCYTIIVGEDDKMIIYESNLERTQNQYEKLDAAFIRVVLCVILSFRLG
jgi:hypothetical protein